MIGDKGASTKSTDVDSLARAMTHPEPIYPGEAESFRDIQAAAQNLWDVICERTVDSHTRQGSLTMCAQTALVAYQAVRIENIQGGTRGDSGA